MYASGEAPRSRKGLPKRGGGMEVMLKLDPKLSKEEFDIALEKALKEFYAEQDAISGETE